MGFIQFKNVGALQTSTALAAGSTLKRRLQSVKVRGIQTKVYYGKRLSNDSYMIVGIRLLQLLVRSRRI